MSTDLPPRPQRRRISVRRRTVAVIASQYNKHFVDGLIENFTTELGIIASNTGIASYEVPGSFEIPVVVQEVAAKGGIDAIVAFGVVIEGQTRHAEMIAFSVTNSLQQIALRFRLPVIHEVLFVHTEEQARARCLDTDLNRGVEAARCVAQMMQTIAEIKAS